MKTAVNISFNRNKFFLLILVLCSSLCYFGEFGKEIDSKFGMFLIPGLVIISFLCISEKPKFQIGDLGWTALLIVLIVLSYLIIGGGLGSVVNNIAAVLFILIFKNTKLDKSSLECLARLYLVLQIYIAGICIYNRYNDGYIGIYNTNTIGMQLVFNLLFIDMYITYRHKWVGIVVNTASIALIIYTRSRSSLIVGALVLLFVFINKKCIFKPRTLNIAYWLMSIIGVSYPFILVKSWQGTGGSFLTKIMDYSMRYFQKSIFSGREAIWAPAINKLTASIKNLLFGIGSHYSEEHFFGGNFHNSYFTIMICCGIITYFLFMVYLFRFYKEGDHATREIQRSRLLYLAVMIVGITESTLFSGHFALMAYLLLCISSISQGDILYDRLFDLL